MFDRALDTPLASVILLINKFNFNLIYQENLFSIYFSKNKLN